MSMIVSYRSNGAGNLTPTSAQRRAASAAIASPLKARFEGELRRQQALQSAAQPVAAKTGFAALQGTAAKTNMASPAAIAAAGKAGDTSGTSTATPKNELNKDAFLQLMVTQMQNQDPMNPTDNAQMLAQLAQFSSLEQMNNLNDSFGVLATNMETLTGNMDQLNFISSQDLLGQSVEGLSSDGKLVNGTVDSVMLDGSIVMLNIGDKIVPMSGVISINGRSLTGSAASAAKKLVKPIFK